MSFDLNDRKAEGTPCRVWTERDRGAVALGDDQRQIRIFAPAEALDDCARTLDRVMNAGGGLMLLDFDDLNPWNGWRLCCRQSMQMPAGQWNKPPAQQIGPEWGQAQGLLLHVALPEEAGLMEVEDLCACFMEVASKDARVLFSTEYSSGDCLSVEALGLTKD